MEPIRAVLRAVARVGAVLAAVAVGVVALAYVFEIVARYGLGQPLNWASDIGSYMLCLTVFFAFPEIARTQGHVAITIVTDMIPARVRAPYERAVALATAMVCFVVAFFLGDIGAQQFEQGVLTAQANQIPRWWLTAVMTGSLALGGLIFLLPGMAAPSEIHPEHSEV